MFYIDTKFRSLLKRDIAVGHLAPTLIVFVAFIGLSILTSVSSKNDIDAKQVEILSRNVSENTQSIESRLNTYEDILRAGKGLFGASDKVTRSEWKQFVESFELNKRYSGIQTVGYAEVVSKKNLANHIKTVRSQDLPDYNIYPAGNRPVYVSLLYLESTNTGQKEQDKPIGLDIYTNKTRRQAMDQARDSGNPIITDIVEPLQANSDNRDSALIMYLPVYSGGKTPATVEARRAKLSGYVFSEFFTDNLLFKGVANGDRNFGFRVYDGETNDQNLLFQSADYQTIDSKADKKSVTETILINNQQWQIVGSVSPDVISESERNRPTSILWGGALFSIFVAGFIYLLLLNRTRISFEEEQREIQDAKDELLALASHQLRTPATGVKQYIGLLRDGYAGKLSREQKAYVEKAYSNNERQLETINNMLFVAKANAKKLDLQPQKFDIRELIESTLDELKTQIKENQQKLSVNLPKKKTYLVGDSKYLRMCIENILTNASKYTPEGGDIDLTLKRNKQSVVIKISDNGVGVAEDDFPLLFRKFSRIPNEFTNKVNGSGIGLYLARKIVTAHGGKIDFESELDKGTTFIIKLPTKQKL